MKNKTDKQPTVIIINGYPGSGKDQFVEYCKEFANVENVLTSTPAKMALRTLGWNGVKTEEARDMLAKLMVMSYEMFNGPVNYVLDKIEKSEADYIFVHVREPENIDLFKLHIPKVKTLILLRDSQKVAYSNPSDSNVENYTYDYRILNNGSLVDLRNYAEAFIDLLKKGWF